MRQKGKAYMRLTVLLFALLLSVSSVYGSVPERINYQGYLTDKSGNPITTPVTITVNIYTVPAGGTPFWSETHNVVPDNGVYNIVLGSLDPLYLDHSVYDLFYLGVKVGSDAEMTPRQEVTSVGSAHTAWTALNLVCTSCVSQTDIDQTSVQRRVTGTCGSGSSIRVINQDGTVTCETDDGITAETDPQVGAVTAGKWCTGDGGAVQCSQNPPLLSETDPQVGTLTANLWCASNAGASAIDCTQPAPALLTHNHDTAYWKLTGNSGTTASHFVGTTDNQILAFRVNNAVALRIVPNATSPSLIGGYNGNSINVGVNGATIGGGGVSGILNRVTDSYGTIGGGQGNQAGNNAGTTEDSAYTTVGGGRNNIAQADAATVGGGSSNNASGTHATIGGGAYNIAAANYATISGGGPADPGNPYGTNNLVTDDYGTIGGGGYNRAGDYAGTTYDATYATVGGGYSNTASFSYATVGGGGGNKASGLLSTVGGGESNTASGVESTVGGGWTNTASGDFSTVCGGNYNTASGHYSFAAGYRAKAYGNGSFVWGDYNQQQDIYAWGTNEFVARATGGFWFITSIGEGGVPMEGMRLPAGTSQWIPIGTTTATSSATMSASSDDKYTQDMLRENDILKQRVDELESRLALLEDLVASLHPGR